MSEPQALNLLCASLMCDMYSWRQIKQSPFEGQKVSQSREKKASSVIRLAYSKLTLEQRCPQCCNNGKPRHLKPRITELIFSHTETKLRLT